MRRLCVLLCLSVIFLTLTGCSGLPGSEKSQGRKFLDSFSLCYQTNVSFESGGLDISASISSPAPDACEITLSAPEHLAGYSYRLDQDGVTVFYRDLKFALDPTGAAGTAPLLRAASALSSLLLPGPEDLPTHQDGYWELTEDLVNGGKVSLRLDEETGLPVKLLLHDGGWEIKLDNFVFFG